MANTSEKEKKEKKKRQSILEAEIMAIMQKSLYAALNAAVNDLLKILH